MNIETIITIVSTVIAFISMLFAGIALSQSKKANQISTESLHLSQQANDIATEANTNSNVANKLSEQANRIAEEAKNLAQQANEIARNQLDVDRRNVAYDWDISYSDDSHKITVLNQNSFPAHHVNIAILQKNKIFATKTYVIVKPFDSEEIDVTDIYLACKSASEEKKAKIPFDWYPAPVSTPVTVLLTYENDAGSLQKTEQTLTIEYDTGFKSLPGAL